ncbi:hypothetical protein [Photobacterium sp. GSS17]|uniref:hypothetical protein n=1 Tax=Photobacterium sp. GSS17 TaxID=3020715 RepID=UPI0023616531|nr:hypothetical protein [Photobacterium sp. GSS17]
MSTFRDSQSLTNQYPHLNLALVMPVSEIERLATFHKQRGNMLCSELFLRALEMKTLAK